jgi:tRNA pseudouridine32 synthase / 23S rRNA pseudouridine746 synthase
MPAVLEHYDPPLDPFLDIIHHDDQIIVINKHAGIFSVPGRPVEHGDCIESRAISVFGTALSVHRLDMETSGVMVMALNKEALRHLSRQFEMRQVTKTYIAVVSGILKDDTGEIEKPLRCDWPNRPRQMVDFDNGRAALTRFKIIERGANNSRVALSPQTGRTHQLRVHMASIGHPILGDLLYGKQNHIPTDQGGASRLMLHAQSLGFAHPGDGQRVHFSTNCPF